MASLAAVKIDAFEFARDGRMLDGTIPLAEFDRLLDVLEALEGEVQVRVEGQRDSDHKSWLHLLCTGSLVLKCQRCLDCMVVRVSIDNRLQLLVGDAELADWPDDELEYDEFDAIPASQPWLVKDLIQDELILQLPVSPMHSACALPNSGTSGHKASPFAALAKLKGH